MWPTIIGFAVVLAVVGVAVWKKLNNIGEIAKESKEVVDAFMSAVSPTSDGGEKITTDELSKLFKEMNDVVVKFREGMSDGP